MSRLLICNPLQALECLIQKTPRLGKDCHHAIFMIKKSELGDSGTDYTLINTCKDMVYKFCRNTESLKLLDCLKAYKDDENFDQRCHLVVVNRMIEQNTDYRFNPSLQSACGKNIDRYCSNVVATAKANEELNGKVSRILYCMHVLGNFRKRTNEYIPLSICPSVNNALALIR